MESGPGCHLSDFCLVEDLIGWYSPLLFVLVQFISISTIIFQCVLIIAPFTSDLVLCLKHLLCKHWVSFRYPPYWPSSLTLLWPSCLFFLKLITDCFLKLFLTLHYSTHLLHILCILFLLFCYGFLFCFFKIKIIAFAFYLRCQLVPWHFLLIFMLNNFSSYLHWNKATLCDNNWLMPRSYPHSF